jgi:hypothetical protein
MPNQKDVLWTGPVPSPPGLFREGCGEQPLLEPILE